jgi:hypothetical protein
VEKKSNEIPLVTASEKGTVRRKGSPSKGGERCCVMVKATIIPVRTASPFERGSLPRDGARPVAESDILGYRLLVLAADRVILLENAIQSRR